MILRILLFHTFLLGWLIASIAEAQAQDKPVFDLDCVNFAGRFMASAPVKKKAHPGLAVDGTSWSLSEEKQVTITRVFPGEAAAKADLQPGDIVVSINGYPVAGMSLYDVFCAYHMYNADTMTEKLTIKQKDGSTRTVTLGLVNPDKCNPEEKCSWLDVYKSLGY